MGERDSRIQKELDARTDIPEIGSLWTHIKGGKYRVLLVTIDEKTEKPVVSYIDATEKCRFGWTRSLDEWNSVLEDGRQRFTMTSSPSLRKSDR